MPGNRKQSQTIPKTPEIGFKDPFSDKPAAETKVHLLLTGPFEDRQWKTTPVSF